MVSADTWIRITIGIGVVLLASPAAIFGYGIGEPTYEYQSFEIEPEADDFGVPERATDFPAPFYIDNIVCLDETRSCLTEQYIHEEGQLPVDASIQRLHGADDTTEHVYIERSPYRYAYLNDSFYRVEEVVDDGDTYLTHESVSPAAAFRRSSVSYSVADPALQEAVDEGDVTTTAELETPRVVVEGPESDTERFHYVHVTSSPGGNMHGPSLGDRLLTYGLSMISFLTGLGLVLRGQRKRIDDRRRSVLE